MKLNFRQGIVTYQRDQSGAPKFLIASQTADYISISVTPMPLTVTFAHGESDYLATFDKSVDNAWGPIQGGVEQYLYVDMDNMTGKLTFGITKLTPVIGNAITPPKIADQHWFDTTDNKMKVWSVAADKWQEKIRVFVGRANSTNSITMFTQGSSVGLATHSDPGYPMLDTLLRPLRTSTGEYLTTTSYVRVQTTAGTSGVLAQPTNAIIAVRAGENIPAMSLVYFSESDVVSLASSNPALVTRRTPVGIIQQDLSINEIGVLTQYGDISYDQWNWTGKIGQALYCDNFGKLTTTRPAGLLAYRVGFIKNKNTIVVGIDAETEAQVYQAGPTQFVFNAVSPLHHEDIISAIGERIITISSQPATASQDGHMTKQQASQITTNTTTIGQHTTSIASLQANKADKSHTHAITDVTGLQAALDGKANVTHNHTITQVTGLQGALDNKADKNHTHSVAQVTGLQNTLDSMQLNIESKAPKVHTHDQSQITNLTADLDVIRGNVSANTTAIQNKADKNHKHVMADVTDLPPKISLIEGDITTLQGDVNTLTLEVAKKAEKVHTHAIADVTGLQSALNGKSDIGHDHSIDDVTNLQTSLDAKADKVHNHVIADVTDLQAALDGKAAVNHTHVLSTLSDVTITNATAGQFLSWNGTKWVNVKAPEGGGGTPGTGLKYWKEGAGKSIDIADEGRYSVDLFPNLAAIATDVTDFTVPPTGIDIFLTPQGVGGIFLGNSAGNGGESGSDNKRGKHTFEVSLGEVSSGNISRNVDHMNGRGIFLGGTENKILITAEMNTIGMNELEIRREEGLYGSTIIGGRQNEIGSKNSAIIHSENVYLSATDTEWIAETNFVASSVDVEVRAKNTTVLNSREIRTDLDNMGSGILDSNTIINSTKLMVAAGASSYLGVADVKASGSIITMVGGGESRLENVGGLSTFNAYGVALRDFQADNNNSAMTIIGGSQTRPNINRDGDQFMTSTVYENGTGGTQVRRVTGTARSGRAMPEIPINFRHKNESDNGYLPAIYHVKMDITYTNSEMPMTTITEMQNATRVFTVDAKILHATAKADGVIDVDFGFLEDPKFTHVIHKNGVRVENPEHDDLISMLVQSDGKGGLEAFVVHNGNDQVSTYVTNFTATITETYKMNFGMGMSPPVYSDPL